ncbi:MAG: hypothetical protein EA373_04590 [Oceanospirillales bacterium]|nr:MAG: hypothetical protein EA373_04590 [Oceanospirillales bacterium]
MRINQPYIIIRVLVTALMTSFFSYSSLLVSASESSHGLTNTIVVFDKVPVSRYSTDEHLKEIYDIAAKGKLTVRALRAWDLLPENLTQLALMLRQHDIDLMSANLVEVKALIALTSENSFLANHLDELKDVAELLASYAAVAADSSEESKVKVEAINSQAINPPEYNLGTPAPTSSSYLTDSIRVPAGSTSTIKLIDGTSVKIPALYGSVEAILERMSLTAATEIQDAFSSVVQDFELTLTGAVRQLRVTGTGDVSALIPELTIPASDLGTINPATLNVLRVGEIYIDGKLQRDIRLLSTTIDQNGNLKFVDPLLRKGVVNEGFTSEQQSNWHFADLLFRRAYAFSPVNATMHGATGIATGNWSVQAQYIVMSFQGSVNWNRPPHLIRMIPQPENAKSGYRRPATNAERTLMTKQPLCNVVLLIHGHNEEEKGGSSVAISQQAPWLFNYKRLVWDQFYEEITRTYETADGVKQALYPFECTAFYELVYPTYRPIFSETIDAGGIRHEPLGAALGVLIQQELINDPQLREMIENDMPFNAMIVAHSQGGLVARAGIRHMPQEFKDRTARLVTWGTPHRGAPMYTLRYSFEAGHDMHIEDGLVVPLHEMSSHWFWGPSFRTGLGNTLNKHLAIDAPGIRDLRWEANLRPLLNMDMLFPTLTQQAEATLNIPVFSQNLSAFNSDSSRERIAGGYTFIVGETTKRVDLKSASISALLSSVSYISIGASLNSYLMRNDWDKANDGAVPLFSQQARGLSFPHPTKILNLGDIDHEEFFGAELELRTEDALELGRKTVQATFSEIALDHPSRSCPVLERVELRLEGDEVRITGRLIFPLYFLANDGNGRLVNSIDRVEIRERHQQGDAVRGVKFNVTDDGGLYWQGSRAILPNTDLVLVVIFKDGSEVIEKVDQAMVTITPPRIVIYELQGGANEVTSNFKAHAQPEGIYQYVWNFGDGSPEIIDTPVKGQASIVSHTFTELSESEVFYPRVRLYSDLTEQTIGKYLDADSITIKVEIEGVEQEGIFTYECGWEVDYQSLTYMTNEDGYRLPTMMDGPLYLFEVGYFNEVLSRRQGPGVSFYDRERLKPQWAMCFTDAPSGNMHGYLTGWYEDGTIWYQSWIEDGIRRGKEYRYYKDDNFCRWVNFVDNDVAIDDGFMNGQCPWRAPNGGFKLKAHPSN